MAQRFNPKQKDVEDVISTAETRGQPDPYSALNKQSGALGKYQLLETYHKEPFEERYNVPFQDLTKYPEHQDDYFKSVLYPGYVKNAEKISKEFPESGIDPVTLTALQQLGAKNVRRYLSGEASDNIKKQVEHFLNISSEKKAQRFNRLKKSVSNKGE